MSNKDRYKIVLLSEKMTDRLIFLGRLWKSINFDVILIFCMENPRFKDFSAFDEVIQAKDQMDAISYLATISPDHVHYFCYGPDLLGQLLLEINIPYFLDYKDLFANVTNFSFMTEDKIDTELRLVKNSKLITNRDHQIHNYIKVNQLEVNENKLIFCPEYVITDSGYEEILKEKIFYSSNSKSDLIKIVMTGGAPTEDGSISISEGILHVVRQLASIDIQVDVIGGFSHSINLENRHKIQNFQPYVDNGLVRLLPNFESKNFELMLLDYDFASNLTNSNILDDTISNNYGKHAHTSYCGSARILSFVKAGLPILLNKEAKFNYDRLADTHFPIQIDKFSLNKLRKSLELSRKSKIREILYFERIKFSESEAQKNFYNNLNNLL